jgi:hypothetical protein
MSNMKQGVSTLKTKVFGGVGTFFQKGSDPPEASKINLFKSFFKAAGQ